MTKRKSTPAGGPWAMQPGLLAVILMVASIACGQGNQGNSPTTSAVGLCHVVCSDFSSSAYVAIAVSPSSLACGTAANLPTSEEAQKRAVAACGRVDCVPVVWGHDGVAALAEDQVAYGWGWAVAASSTADARAIASCESRTP
jgi:hypothetical protein